jgi:hypothetical protein
MTDDDYDMTMTMVVNTLRDLKPHFNDFMTHKFLYVLVTLQPEAGLV